jgi:ribosome-binding factor A
LHFPRQPRFLIFSCVLSEGIKVERRKQKHHRERLGEAMREEIATLLEGELGDPRLGLVSVSELHLAADARSARVFVAVEGNDQQAARTMAALHSASAFIRRELTERLHLRRAPELFFQLDRSPQLEARVEELLSRARKGTPASEKRRI